MSRQYTDAEKLAYYKAKAKGKGAPKKTYKKKVYNKSDAYYSYKANERKAERDEKEARRKRGPGMLSAAGGLVGTGVASYLGLPQSVGATLGGHAGHLIEQITGFGDYNISSNSLMKGGMTPPQVVNSMSKGGYIIRHREYLCDVYATTAFNIQTFPLNPGIAASFPWLSQIAGSFEEYRWRGLLFEVKSLSSDALLSTAQSSALGAVIMATQYNALSPPFTDKRAMENYEFANSNKPSVSFIHPIECKSSVTPLTKLYVRNGAIPPNADQRLYDLGEFNIATQGMQANSGVVCELWATYEIEFFKNKYNPTDMTDHFDLLNGYSDARPLATNVSAMNASALARGSSLGCQVRDNSIGGSDLVFPPNVPSGTYYVTITWIGVTAATLVYPAVGTTNCSVLQWFQGDGATSQVSPTAISSLTASVQYFIRLNGQNAVLTINPGTLPGGATTRVQIVVTQVSGTLTG